METIIINKLINLDFRRREAYKTLRSNIQFCGSDNKVIGFTSSIPDEGKSSTSLNLAVSLSEIGKKVIFIDGDLRKSVMIGRYKISKEVKGLSHYLTGIHSEERIIYDTNIENLHMIFSGPIPPNPSELFNNKKFFDLISKFRNEYDYVIIDTPPLGSVIDSAIISQVCDGMVLVVESNAISYRLAQTVKEQLEKSGCKILGAVLNKADFSKKGHMGKYYGKYYCNYGEYE